MPDAYIDRWDTSGAGAHSAVWMVVAVPENCPRPTSKRIQKRERQNERRI